MTWSDGAAGPYYRRFRPEDLDAADREIEALAKAISDPGRLSDAELMASHLDLASLLIQRDREVEALSHVDAAREIAARLGDTEGLIEAYLNLGTAQQYLGERDAAQESYQLGLDLCASSGRPAQAHFLLQHRGRCFVEQGRVTEARNCFEQALATRVELGDERLIRSSADALAHLPDDAS